MVSLLQRANGPLLNALGASHAQSIASSRVTCFCEHHQRAAKAAGINFDRAREGYIKLDQLVQNALANKRPGDGYFVAWWRLLVTYPEIIAWDSLFDGGKTSGAHGNKPGGERRPQRFAGRFSHRARELVQSDLSRDAQL